MWRSSRCVMFVPPSVRYQAADRTSGCLSDRLTLHLPFHPFIFLYFLTSTLNASFFVFSLPSWFLSSFPSSPLILFLVVLSHLFHSSFTLFSLCFTPPPPFFPPLQAFYYHFLWPPLVIRRFPTPSSRPHISQPERLKWNIINNPVYWNLLSAVSLSLFNKRLVTVFPI